jgi:hypothetical protein
MLHTFNAKVNFYFLVVFICYSLFSKTSGDNSMFKNDDDDVYIKTESTNDGYFHDFGSGGLPLKVHLKEESESNDRGHE